LRNAVSRIASIISESVSLNDTEDLVRHAVLAAIKDKARILTTAEIETIAEAVVEDETAVDQDFIEEHAAKRIKDGSYHLSDMELNSLSTDDWYTAALSDNPDIKYVLAGRKFYPVSVYKDERAKGIVSRIAYDIQYAQSMLRTEQHLDDISFVEEPPTEFCPECGSDDVVKVWEDGEVSTFLCTDCDLEFTDIEPDNMFDDIELFDNCFASVYPQSDGWYYEIWFDGIMINEGSVNEPDEVLEFLQLLGDAYHLLETEDVLIAGVQKTITGREEKLDYAFKIANKEAVTVPRTAIYDDLIEVGDTYLDSNNNMLRVSSIVENDIFYASHTITEEFPQELVASRNEFLTMVDEGDYLLQ